MTDKQVAELIRVELVQKTLGVTEQYLEIHELEYENGDLKISRIDRESENGLIIAYLPIVEEYFSLAVYINPISEEIQNIGTESRNTVVLRATSETLTAAELQSFVKAKATTAINKGDLKRHKKSAHTFSILEFEPNPEPDQFEDKLEKLLTFLENETDAFIALGKEANLWVDVTMDFHSGNQFLGKAFISLSHMKRLGALNLAVDFDLTSWGNPFK